MTKRADFTKEFEREAVRLAETSGRTRKEVAAELKRLRRENEILRQERDILKKATVDSICQRNINFQWLLS